MATKKTSSATGETTKKTSSSRTRGTSSAKKSSSKRPRPPSTKGVGAGEVGAMAASVLAKLVGRETESVTSVHRNDDGWQVQVEVLESRRIPETTDVMGLYEVEMDVDGELRGYRRVRRYARGRTGEEG